MRVSTNFSANVETSGTERHDLACLASLPVRNMISSWRVIQLLSKIPMVVSPQYQICSPNDTEPSFQSSQSSNTSFFLHGPATAFGPISVSQSQVASSCMRLCSSAYANCMECWSLPPHIASQGSALLQGPPGALLAIIYCATGVRTLF